MELLLLNVFTVDNGIGLTPPMGWRHWKAFYAHIDQSIMETMMDTMIEVMTIMYSKLPRKSHF